MAIVPCDEFMCMRSSPDDLTMLQVAFDATYFYCYHHLPYRIAAVVREKRAIADAVHAMEALGMPCSVMSRVGMMKLVAAIFGGEPPPKVRWSWPPVTLAHRAVRMYQQQRDVA